MNQKHMGQIFLNIHLGLKIKGKVLGKKILSSCAEIRTFGKNLLTFDKFKVEQISPISR